MGLFFNDEQFALYVDRLIANIHPVNGAMTDSWCYAEAVKWVLILLTSYHAGCFLLHGLISFPAL